MILTGQPGCPVKFYILSILSWIKKNVFTSDIKKDICDNNLFTNCYPTCSIIKEIFCNYHGVDIYG